MTAITRVTKKKFWMLISSINEGTFDLYSISAEFSELKNARACAEECAIKNPGKKYYILEAIECYEGTVNLVTYPCKAQGKGEK